MMINDQCMIKRLTAVPLLFALPTLDILTRETLEGYRGG